MRDFYQILGVSYDAEEIVIKAAYKAMAQRYHPDKWTGSQEEAHKKMAEINEAYETLSNSEMRQQYDEYLREIYSEDDVEEEYEEVKAAKNNDSTDKYHCDKCGCLITGKMFREQEKVEAGSVSGTQRSGLFDYNVFNWKYSDHQFYQNVWMHYCEKCYFELKAKRRFYFKVAIWSAITVVALISLVIYFGSIEDDARRLKERQQRDAFAARGLQNKPAAPIENEILQNQATPQTNTDQSPPISQLKQDHEQTPATRSSQNLNPSFDCAKAGNLVENLICANPELIKLDLKLSALYSAAYENSPNKVALKSSQVNWIKSRNLCTSSDCILNSYSNRIKEFGGN